jgi:hypothetical protein
VRQTGVTWEASPLNLEDYFNAQASCEKYMLKKVENIDQQNATITRNGDLAKRANTDRALSIGSLNTILHIARDIVKPFGIVPPTVYEEIEYAWQLAGQYDTIGHHDAAKRLVHHVEMAQKWDPGAIHTLRELFEKIEMNMICAGMDVARCCGKNGIYPVIANVMEHAHDYTCRWTTARHVENLARLPMFGEKNIIRGSETMPFEGKVLVLRPDALTEEYRKPENVLWTLRFNENITDYTPEDTSPVTRFKAENMITGDVITLRRLDFLGVLRPEYVDNIDFEVLKQEYAALRTRTSESENDMPEEDGDWEMEG